MSKDLTKLSKKELESTLAKKYGVDRYLNQKSQLLDLLGRKGETDIQSGFTGPETEAMSIMLENIMKSSKKAEGGIVALLGGGPVIGSRKNARNGILSLWTGSDEDGEGVSEAAASAEAGVGGGDDTEGDTSGTYGGDSHDMGIDSSLSDMQSIQAGLESIGPADIGGDDNSDYAEKAREEAQQEQEKEDIPLTEAELDYYARGMGTATRPLKTLSDVNEYMSKLIGTTASPTGAKLSKDKKFLILPNGKIINLRTGKVQESMSGLELFRGGLI